MQDKPKVELEYWNKVGFCDRCEHEVNEAVSFTKINKVLDVHIKTRKIILNVLNAVEKLK